MVLRHFVWILPKASLRGLISIYQTMKPISPKQSLLFIKLPLLMGLLRADRFFLNEKLTAALAMTEFAYNSTTFDEEPLIFKL